MAGRYRNASEPTFDGAHPQRCRVADMGFHASDAELARRVRELSEEKLAGLLGPAALLPVIACQTSS